MLLESLRHLRDEDDHTLVVRNGKSHHERAVHLGAGSVKVRTPRVSDRRPEHTFASKILLPYVRHSPRLEEDRLACLVVVGVLPDGRREVIALEDGYRESTESRAASSETSSVGA